MKIYAKKVGLRFILIAVKTRKQQPRVRPQLLGGGVQARTKTREQKPLDTNFIKKVSVFHSRSKTPLKQAGFDTAV